MTDADEVKFSLRDFAVEDGLEVGIMEESASGRLEEGGAGQFVAAFGHTHLTFPFARFPEFGLTAKVGLDLAHDHLLGAPTAKVPREAGDDGGGAFGATSRDRQSEFDFTLAFARDDGGADLGQECELLIAQRLDQAQLRL